MFKLIQKKFKHWDKPTYPDTFDPNIGIYVHIPFCERICPFCPYLKAKYQPEKASSYLQAIKNELEALNIKNTHSIYVGGGTPTLMTDLFPLLAKINVKNEFAVEILPSQLNDNLANFLIDCNVNYISVGIQSMNDNLLRYLKRPNTADDNRKCLNIAKNKFKCIDVDLIFDVANFSPEIALNDFKYCLDAQVHQISTYPLMRFGFTPFGKAKHNQKLEYYVLSQMTKLATDAGYKRRSVWTFTRTDEHYTSITRPKYFGIGASAATYTGSYFWVNTFDIDKYITRLLNRKSAIELYIPMKNHRKFIYETFWQLYNGHASALPFPISILTLTGHLTKSKYGFSLTSKGYNLYHKLEQWVTYNYIEPLWQRMYSLANINPLQTY